MQTLQTKTPSTLAVVTAFATVYIVWGSTYFFIQKAVHSFPPFFLGAFRFIAAGVLLMGWALFRGENVFKLKTMKPAIISGLLMLFVGNGIVIWVEQFLPSGMVAIMVSSSPLWFVILDKPKWHDNLGSKSTILGLVIGFSGVALLFSERILVSLASLSSTKDMVATGLLVMGSIAWASGSLYSKYYSAGSSAVTNTTWQMLAAGLAFIPGIFAAHEMDHFELSTVGIDAWLSVIYLVIFGSIVGFSAYVWLLKVQPATKVSTYAYVNPVVAVLLGIFFAGEHISLLQISGLVVILVSVMLINLHQYKKVSKSTIAGA
jgi:drug/metabolite transporter (DMT)-like permease